MTIEKYDAILIGSGQATGPLSTEFAKSGKQTVLIEREHFGGTCINEGCTPTKTMIASAEVAYLARRAADYGIECGTPSVDMVAVRERKRDLVRKWEAGSRDAIERGGAEIVSGEASFLSPRQVRVTLPVGGERALESDIIVIDAGARPAIPPIPGLNTIDALTSTSIMELDVVPDHLVLIGGGYIGVEFSQMFRRFGSRVTILQLDDTLLVREDPDISQAVHDILIEDGVEICLGARTTQVRREGVEVALTIQTKARTHEVRGSHVLVSAGRSPNTSDLNLDIAGIELTEHGTIKVNDRLETTARGVYAVGDVAGSPNFTHISYDDFRILRDNILCGANRTTRDRMIPYTVFIDPQLGRVGMTESEANRKGIATKVATMPMSRVARAAEVGRDRGLMKAVVDANNGQILGCAVLGIDGGEVMAMLQIAMMGKLPYTDLRDGIFAHPTLAEAMNNLFATT